jgi:hypothetical protein
MVIKEIRFQRNRETDIIEYTYFHQTGAFHLPMSSADEADEAPAKRRRIVKKTSEEQEDKESPTGEEGVGTHSGRDEGFHSKDRAGDILSSGPEPRYSGYSMEYPTDPMMGQGHLQRPQMEGAENQYGLGRGVPAEAAAMGSG